MNNRNMPACASVCDNVRLCELPIAFAFVPIQNFCNLHDASTALERGTLYKELDMPFLGSECRK